MLATINTNQHPFNYCAWIIICNVIQWVSLKSWRVNFQIKGSSGRWTSESAGNAPDPTQNYRVDCLAILIQQTIWMKGTVQSPNIVVVWSVIWHIFYFSSTGIESTSDEIHVKLPQLYRRISINVHKTRTCNGHLTDSYIIMSKT